MDLKYLSRLIKRCFGINQPMVWIVEAEERLIYKELENVFQLRFFYSVAKAYDAMVSERPDALVIGCVCEHKMMGQDSVRMIRESEYDGCIIAASCNELTNYLLLEAGADCVLEPEDDGTIDRSKTADFILHKLGFDRAKWCQ